MITDQIRSWPVQRWLAAAGVALAVAVVTGVPTDLIPTSLFGRPIAVTWWDYPIWAGMAILVGLFAATYVDASARAGNADRPKLAYSGGLLSFFAVGCPTCNKVAVLALGVGGASSTFATIQPFLGLAGIALLSGALAVRLKGLSACSTEIDEGLSMTARST